MDNLDFIVETESGPVQFVWVGIEELKTGDKVAWLNNRLNRLEVCQVFVDRSKEDPNAWLLLPSNNWIEFGWVDEDEPEDEEADLIRKVIKSGEVGCIQCGQTANLALIDIELEQIGNTENLSITVEAYSCPICEAIFFDNDQRKKIRKKIKV